MKVLSGFRLVVSLGESLKIYSKKLVRVGLAVIAGITIFVSSVYACHPWINMNSYTLGREGTARFHIVLGHNFPFGHSFFDNARIGEMYILGPDGERQKVRQRVLRDDTLSQVQFESESKLEEGTHLVVMETKGRFRARTADGWQRKSRRELEGEEILGKVSYSQNWVKAIVNVGEKSGEGFSQILGHGLEIVPLKDPGKLRTNDFLPLKVLHNGEPLEEHVRVYATYMGFSTSPDAFAYTSWAFAGRGEARIRLLEPGIWMIFVRHRLPHSDPALADQYSFSSTLTFEVKP